MSNYHTPVLLHNCLEGLNIKPNGIYVDVTYGGGGHSREILKQLDENGKLVVFDQDMDAIANVINDNRVIVVQQNFKYLKNFLRHLNVFPVDGILADLGVSSHQFDEPQRGFSTRFDGPLDMRMDQSSKKTAAEIVNYYEEDKLRWIFKNYGELDAAGRLAREICAVRKSNPILTGQQLKAVGQKFATWGKENQFNAQVFQALRIEVNNELTTLKDMLLQTIDALKVGGRLVVISYHSLEDRLVKNFIRSGKFEGDAETDVFGNRLVPFKVITKKPIIPEDSEIDANSRSRSAKLRIAERSE